MGIAHAEAHGSVQFVPAAEAITDLNHTLEQVSKQSKLPVLFPTAVPISRQNKLFAFSAKAPDYNQYWQIAVTTNAQCRIHGCIVGSVSAQKEGKLEKNYIQALVPKVTYALKQKVKLKNNVIGYFTPGHAEADWHPPAMEWQIDGVSYVLSWDIKENSKQVLSTMANTAIENFQGPD
jgi:hypothetical protein